jgi:hypothetical protein
MVRVVVVRNSRGAGWTFDLTEKTDLAELAERIEATIRDVNCTSCEMRAIDAEGRTIDNFPYRVETPGVAQLVTTPAATQLPFPVEESIGAVMKTHRSMTALNLQGIAENYDFAKQIITEQRKQITALVEAVAVARGEHAADVVALRKDYNSEMAAMRQENAELRKRVAEQWALEDPARSKMLDKQVEVQEALTKQRIAESVFSAVMAKVTGGASSPAGQSALMHTTMRLFQSLTPEQLKKVFDLLTQDQQILLIELVEQAQKAAQGEASSANGSDPHVNGSVAANIAAAIANSQNAKKS